MKIKLYTIDFEISPGAKRFALGLGIPTLIVCAAAVASANVKHPFASGDKLSAQLMNENFSDLDARLTKLESQERVVTAIIDKLGAVTQQTGTWISLVNHSGVGSYVVSFANGTFSTTPTCVATALAGNNAPPIVECFNVANNSITCVAKDAGTMAVDTGLLLVCIGAK